MSTHSVGVFASAFDAKSRILCVKQAYGSRRWTTPGGTLEQNECPLAGVLRELREETGFEGTVESFIGAYVHLYKEPNDVVLSYRIRLGSRNSWRPNAEIEDIGFFSSDSLPENIAFNTRIRIEDAFARRSGLTRSFDTRDSLLSPAHCLPAGRIPTEKEPER